MNSVSPVLTSREVESEQVIALDQPEYYPIIVCRIIYPDGSLGTVTRFRFTPEEREAIARGADLILSQPHHGAFDADRIAARYDGFLSPARLRLGALRGKR